MHPSRWPEVKELHRPIPFSASQRCRLESIKRIAAAEQEEAQRTALAALWEEYRSSNWITEAFETRDSIRQQQEKQRLLDQVRMEVVVSDLEG